MPARMPLRADISAWIAKAHGDADQYRERQATHIFLTALALAPEFADTLFLKGGILMGIVYDSPRQTGDIDFTAKPNVELTDVFVAHLHQRLDDCLARAAAQLGYLELRCKVQTIRRLPNPRKVHDPSFPALQIRIGFAMRSTNQEELLLEGRATRVLEADISFREPVSTVELIAINDDMHTISAYSLVDLMAEKLRALLQQKARRRNRRQDVYDLALLIERFPLDYKDKAHLLSVFAEKCKSRDLKPNQDSLSDPEIKNRAGVEWNTLRLELADLPSFEERFSLVEAYYRNLPWEQFAKSTA